MKLKIGDTDYLSSLETIATKTPNSSDGGFDNNAIRKLRLGDTLIEMGYITSAQLRDALAYQKEHNGERIGAILIALGFVTEKQLIGALAEKLNLRVIDVSNIKVDIKAVDMIPEQLAVDGISHIEEDPLAGPLYEEQGKILERLAKDADSQQDCHAQWQKLVLFTDNDVVYDIAGDFWVYDCHGRDNGDDYEAYRHLASLLS